MILPSCEIYQISAFEFESGNPIANCLCSFRSHFSYCLPYFFENDLNILWKCFDVFIYSLELLLFSHSLSHYMVPDLFGSWFILLIFCSIVVVTVVLLFFFLLWRISFLEILWLIYLPRF